MQQKSNYQNYFKNHYQYAFCSDDLENYKKWFTAWFRLIKKQIPWWLNEKNILEIGSWIWWFYQFIREYKSSYIGVEMDSDAVQWSNDYFWNKFICSSFEDFTWKDFDLIFAFEVLEHLLHPLESIDKIYNLLNVWGLFIWSSPYPYPKNIYADETHRFCLHPENRKKLFNDAWFVTHTIPMSFFPYIRRISPLLNVRLPFYIPFKYFMSTTLIIARK